MILLMHKKLQRKNEMKVRIFPFKQIVTSICCLAVIALFFGVFQTLTMANMNSDSYIIQYNNINMTGGEKSSSSFTVTDTVGETGVGRYTGTGYLVRSGFQYVYTIGRFSFSISNTMVDLGTLTPAVFSTGTTTLTVSAKGAGGYNVTAHENYSLTKVGTPAQIPDTTCNSSNCDQATAAIWNDASKPGFGYSMNGTDIPAAFVSDSYFKQFANLSLNEPPQIIMSNAGVVKSHQATVTYKVAVDGSQEAGNYENNIVYIATPGY
jgi:hypothetical protein